MPEDDPQRPDERPRPQYGEYAPPGWTWQPPEDAAPPPVPPAAPSPASSTAVARPGDRTATILLLVVGIMGALFGVAIMLQLPEAMRMLHAQEGLPAYSPDAAMPTITVGGAVVQVLLWLAAAGSSFLLLRRGRRAFWVPLVAGVLAAIALFVFVSLALAVDPVLLEHFSTTPPTFPAQ